VTTTLSGEGRNHQRPEGKEGGTAHRDQFSKTEIQKMEWPGREPGPGKSAPEEEREDGAQQENLTRLKIKALRRRVKAKKKGQAFKKAWEKEVTGEKGVQ